MENHDYKILWGYLTELRKELVESQKIRTQVIGFKITFVTALIGFISAKLLMDVEKTSEFMDEYYYLLLIPAIASIFFDFLIYSYSFSIKRIGLYIRYELEPRLGKMLNENNMLMWQKFLDKGVTKQKLALIGNLGITLIAVVIAIASILWFSRHYLATGIVTIVLLSFVAVDFWAMKQPARMVRKIRKKYKKTERNRLIKNLKKELEVCRAPGKPESEKE